MADPSNHMKSKEAKAASAMYSLSDSFKMVQRSVKERSLLCFSTNLTVSTAKNSDMTAQIRFLETFFLFDIMPFPFNYSKEYSTTFSSYLYVTVKVIGLLCIIIIWV